MTSMWHLVHVMAGWRDRHAVEWLDRRGFSPYYPQLRSMRRVPLRQVNPSRRHLASRIFREVLEPLFPRYIFVHLELPVRYDLLRISGVMGIVCEGGRPVPIADRLVNNLRGAESAGAIPGATPAGELFRVGEVVEIREGPFAYWRGPIEHIACTSIEGVDVQTRLTVAIELFGRLTPTHLDVHQVARVAAG